MTRLFSAIRQDFLLQKRYGLYYAGAFITLVWIVLLRQLPPWTLDIALPFVIFEDLGIVGFYFIAGMFLFEKGEGTLPALIVTPLRFSEYLASKLATLTALSLAVTLAVVLTSYGPGFNPFLLVTGVILTSLIALLVGFISVLPFASISTYIPAAFTALPAGHEPSPSPLFRILAEPGLLPDSHPGVPADAAKRL